MWRILSLYNLQKNAFSFTHYQDRAPISFHSVPRSLKRAQTSPDDASGFSSCGICNPEACFKTCQNACLLYKYTHIKMEKLFGRSQACTFSLRPYAVLLRKQSFVACGCCKEHFRFDPSAIRLISFMSEELAPRKLARSSDRRREESALGQSRQIAEL